VVVLLAATLIGCAAGIYAPLIARLMAIERLRHALLIAIASTDGQDVRRRDAMNAAFEGSPLVLEWWEFARRMAEAREALPASARAFDDLRTPVRLRDVLTDSPALPRGVRREGIGAAPGWLAGLGVLGGALAAASASASDGSPALAAIAPLVWGGAGWLVTSIASRVLVGRFDAEADALDRLVETAYPSISLAELTTRAAYASAAPRDPVVEDAARSLGHAAAALGLITKKLEALTASTLAPRPAATQEPATESKPPESDASRRLYSVLGLGGRAAPAAAPTAPPARGPSEPTIPVAPHATGAMAGLLASDPQPTDEPAIDTTNQKPVASTTPPAPAPQAPTPKSEAKPVDEGVAYRRVFTKPKGRE
jgi:hypothetical protein